MIPEEGQGTHQLVSPEHGDSQVTSLTSQLLAEFI